MITKSNDSSNEIVLPLVVAVTGHRDLVPEEIPQIRAHVVDLLQKLKTEYSSNRLTVMSPLAEGADMLVAEVAKELGLDLVVPLPKPREAYLRDFSCDTARQKFDEYCGSASQVIELAYTIPPVPEGFDPQAWQDAYPYALLGTFLCAHCHILLAIWDGLESLEILSNT